MFFLWYLLIGLVAGWLANLIVKGRGSGLIVNLVVGIVGGVLSSLLGALIRLPGLVRLVGGSGLFAVRTFRRRNHRQYRHFGSRCYRIVVDRSCRRQ